MTASPAGTTSSVDDNLRRHREARQAAGIGAGVTGADKGRRAAPKARTDRWTEYNQFVDVIAPRLTLAERAVWHVMFRHARNGVVETSVRMLAGGAAVSQSTTQQAIGRLQEAGLVWPIWKSNDRSKASKYAMHPSPGACLARLMP
jgi:hypothetical protein